MPKEECGVCVCMRVCQVVTVSPHSMSRVISGVRGGAPGCKILCIYYRLSPPAFDLHGDMSVLHLVGDSRREINE